MARHLFFAITLIGAGVFLNLPAQALMDAAQCVKIKPQIAWADVTTPGVVRAQINVCTTAIGR